MPTAEDRRAFISEAVRRLREDAGATRVVLFGSEAAGTAQRDSDVDLLVIVDSDEEPLERRVRLRHLIGGRDQRVPFDLWVLTPREFERRLSGGDPFLKGVLERGRTLHAA